MTPLEGLTKAIGSLLGELAGMRSTRLLLPALVGNASLTVETTLDWPDTGKVIIGTQEYDYSSITPTSLVGITHDVEGTTITGVKVQAGVGVEVLDWSRTYSAMDRLRLSFFVNSAVGADLATIGRNLGVPRHPSLDDDTYRNLIKAIAYTSKGTLYAIERVLVALFGVGGFTLWEDLKATSNTVFINVGGANALLTEAQGNTYLGREDPLLYDDVANTVTLPFDPLGVVQGVRLADEDFAENIALVKLSSFNEIRFDGDAGQAIWAYTGANEGTAVTIVATGDGANLFDNTGGDLPHYKRGLRIQPESEGAFTCRFAVDSDPIDASKGLQWVMEVHDTAVACRIGALDTGSDYALGFVDAAGAFIAGPATASALPFADMYEVEIRKRGSTWQFYVEGSLISELDSAALPASALHFISVGATDATTSLVQARVADVYFYFETLTNYASIRGTGAAVDSGSPTVLDTNSALVNVADVGKGVRTFDSAVANGFGGNNNGQWTVEAVVDTDNVTLTGAVKAGAFVETAFPNRITSQEDRAFNFPQNLGHTVQLLDVGPNQGEWTVAHILDTVTGYPLQLQSADQGDQILVVGAATGKSGANGAVLTANGDRFIDATAAAFAIGDVNSYIYVPTSTELVNAGVFRITGFVSVNEVIVDSIAQGQSFADESDLTWAMHNGAAFTTETGLSWRMKPQFVTEASLSWSLSDAVDLTAAVVTLRADPPGFNFANIALILRAVFTTVYSAHLLPDEFEVNSKTADGPPKEFAHWPFYMEVDILAALREYLGDLTVAGVIPEISETPPS